MTNDRAYALQAEFAARIKEIYRETIHFQRTNEQHLDRMIEAIWDKIPAKFPARRRAYLQGVADTLFAHLYESEIGHLSYLEWVLVGPDGRRFREGDDSWLKESDEYKTAMGNSVESTHAWRRAMDKGEFKPF